MVSTTNQILILTTVAEHQQVIINFHFLFNHFNGISFDFIIFCFYFRKGIKSRSRTTFMGIPRNIVPSIIMRDQTLHLLTHE